MTDMETIMDNENHNPLADNSTDNIPFKSFFEKESSSTSNNNNAKKIQHIKFCLHSDIDSCDFTWSLFQSALNSYRFDTCLRPYPPMFLKNGYKDPTKMKAVCDLVPDMKTLKNKIEQNVFPQDVIDLLHWVLINQRDPYLKLIVDDNSRPKTSVVLDHISEKQLTIVPNYIYKVIYSKQHEEQWQLRKTDKNNSIYAFHGSRLDNFYSIIKFGLQQHMSCSETLFGAGIYLSSELMLSLTYSPVGITWEKSMHGSSFSIVALCEIINDVAKVKCQDVADKKRCVNVGSIGGTVPDKYYVVLNSELVRVRYLLVYKQSRAPETNKHLVRKNNIFYRWLSKHKMIVLLVFYIFLLVFIGFVNSSTWTKYQRVFKNYLNDK